MAFQLISLLRVLANNRPKIFFWAIACSLAIPWAAPGEPLRDYRQLFAVGIAAGDRSPVIILRSFKQEGNDHYLTVDPVTLRTAVLPADQVRAAAEGWEAVKACFIDSPYLRALSDAARNSGALQNAGLVHVLSKQMGVDLTVDLCPSHRPLDRALFTEVIRAFGREEGPVPLAVAVTGLWMEKHPNDLAWLRRLAQKNEIAVTWINHSYHHRVSPDLPLRENFLLEKGTDVEAEVLGVEAKMIEEGLTPSVFFRFPGLVSDDRIFNQVLSYGLIPVGSDAWLGKNQWPKPGSIVLVHANGNEPIEIRRFLRLVRGERDQIAGKHWLLYDLRESTARMEKEKKD